MEHLLSESALQCQDWVGWGGTFFVLTCFSLFFTFHRKLLIEKVIVRLIDNENQLHSSKQISVEHFYLCLVFTFLNAQWSFSYTVDNCSISLLGTCLLWRKRCLRRDVKPGKIITSWLKRRLNKMLEGIFFHWKLKVQFNLIKSCLFYVDKCWLNKIVIKNSCIDILILITSQFKILVILKHLFYSWLFFCFLHPIKLNYSSTLQCEWMICDLSLLIKQLMYCFVNYNWKTALN